MESGSVLSEPVNISTYASNNKFIVTKGTASSEKNKSMVRYLITFFFSYVITDL